MSASYAYVNGMDFSGQAQVNRHLPDWLFMVIL